MLALNGLSVHLVDQGHCLRLFGIVYLGLQVMTRGFPNATISGWIARHL